MKRLTLVLVLFSFILFNCETSNDKALVGTWEIVEFRMIGEVEDPGRDEEYLRNEGAVWDISFSKNGEFKQSFNMRSPDKRIEVEEGTWRTLGDTLKIELKTDSIPTKWEYAYELNDDLLTLTLSTEKMGSKLITKFREK